jgi:aromatic ring-opening dioxygenase catalytic subunit (LigB family)
MTDEAASVLYIPHGGGPLPLMGDPGHEEMVVFLKNIATAITKPSVILVVSAHWEEEVVTITSSETPALIYDYYGFSDEAYEIKYPVDGDTPFASKICNLLQDHGIKAKLDS